MSGDNIKPRSTANFMACLHGPNEICLHGPNDSTCMDPCKLLHGPYGVFSWNGACRHKNGFNEG